MNRRLTVALLTLVIGLAAAAGTNAAQLAPTDDAMAYEFIPVTPWGPTFPFSTYLPAGNTTTGHDVKSALRFDVSSLGLTSADVTSATLDLFVIPTEATGFGISATPSDPVTVNLNALAAGAWDEATVTWASMPAAGALYDSQAVTGTNYTVSFDVTQLVKDWLDGTIPNNGLLLSSNVPVGASPFWGFATFASSNNPTVAGPVLNVVPEPGSIALAACAAPALIWLGRRRLRGRNR